MSQTEVVSTEEVATDVVSSREFFLYGHSPDQSVNVRTPDGAILKPIDDQGIYDHCGVPVRQSFVDIVETGSSPNNRLQPEKTALWAVDREGGCHFLAYDAS